MINSRRSRFTVAPSSVNHQGHPLSRTYGAILQSSLTTVLPSALDFSSRLPVSVLVRSRVPLTLEAFLGRPSYVCHIITMRMAAPLDYEGGFTILPPRIGRQDTNTCQHFSDAVPPSVGTRHRNIDLLSIVYAFRPRLRYRLTLSGFTLLRKP